MVVFEDGLARKSEYRRFVIRTVEGSNDVAAMHEVITRRFRRLLAERADAAPTQDGPLLIDPETGAPRKFSYLPGLVVVDGGAPQVAAAARALTELGNLGSCAVWSGQTPGRGLVARSGVPGDPAPVQ